MYDLFSSQQQCAVLEKIHPHPMEGQGGGEGA